MAVKSNAILYPENSMLRDEKMDSCRSKRN